jgi:nucleoside-diphosphate-sugar epimerase
MDGRGMSVRFFITGGQGFVGRYLVAHLLETVPDAEVIAIGRSPALSATFSHSIEWAGERLRAPLPPHIERALSDQRYRYASLDLRDGVATVRVLRASRPDVVIHLASGLRGDPAPDLLRTNLEGTRVLVEGIAEAATTVCKLIVCSTGGVYGAAGGAALPFEESAPCRPPDSYAATKLAAERVARRLGERHGIATVTARVFNIVGPGEDDRHVGPQLARQAAEILCGVRPPIVEVGDLEATRDFIDVRDVAQALAMLAQHGVGGATYNVATGVETSIASLLDTTLQAARFDRAVEIRRRRSTAIAARRHAGHPGRLRGLGFRPRYELGESMQDLVSYYTTTVALRARENHRKGAGAVVAGSAVS